MELNKVYRLDAKECLAITSPFYINPMNRYEVGEDMVMAYFCGWVVMYMRIPGVTGYLEYAKDKNRKEVWVKLLADYNGSMLFAEQEFFRLIRLIKGVPEKNECV